MRSRNQVPSLTLASNSWANLPDSVIEKCFGCVHEGVIVADMRRPGQPICFVNDAFQRITGYSEKDALGKNCSYLQGSDRSQPEIDLIRTAIAGGSSIGVVMRNYTNKGGLFLNKLNLHPVKDDSDILTHYVGILSDVTSEFEAGKQIDRLSHLDDITGLLNRAYFNSEFIRLMRETSHGVLLLKIDIVRFHDVNSGYGYDIGDALLREVAQRLRSTGAFAIGRMGSNEFALAFRAETNEEADAIVGRTLALMQPPYPLPGTLLALRFYSGYVFASAEAERSTLIRQAGTALHRSKRGGGPDAQTYDAADEAEARRRVRLTTELRHAIEANEFYLEYQPKVALQTGVLIGAEALIRWRHPIFGSQPPSLFINHAEEIGLIGQIDAWAVREAAHFACKVNEARRTPITISVNVSGAELNDREVLKTLNSIFSDIKVNPSWLILELTETTMVKSSSPGIQLMHDVRKMGVGLSVDDFGTGYSSLRYLETLPITELKIDRSFVQDLATSSTKRIIVESLIKLGVESNIAIVAEGIETENELNVLKAMGCSYGQGYLFGRPEGADRFLARASREPIWSAGIIPFQQE
jgi:diguanylate cyclase (GGDEF)-like protein/PAS domain S-box-containing protein